MSTTQVYKVVQGHDVQFRVSPAGKAIVTIRSANPMKFRAIYAGTAHLGFSWVSSGKSSSWMFQPTMLNPEPTQFTETTENRTEQVLNVEMGKDASLTPAVGFLTPNLSGAIHAPAIHFDIPNAYDLWIFLLRTTPSTFNLRIDKNNLAVSSGNASATALIRRYADASGQGLTADLTVLSDGFRKVRLSVNRTLKSKPEGGLTTPYSGEETIGEATSGTNTYTWKPTQRSLNMLLVTSYAMTIKLFADFLPLIGAEILQGMHLSANYLKNSFILNDNPTVHYTVRLSGEKRFIGKVQDEARLTLT